MGAAAVRRCHGGHDLDLAARLGDADRQDAADRSSAGRPDQQSREASASSGQGHRNLSHQRSQLRADRSEEHTSELQSRLHLVCRLLLEKKKKHPWKLESQEKSITNKIRYL